MYDQYNDGKNHINIYSKGMTELGRFLSNFSHTEIQTDDGPFSSIEAYWYWLSSRNEGLRKLHGFKARQFGKTLTRTYTLSKDSFEYAIRTACWNKLHIDARMYNMFKDSTLPFKHYYVFNNHPVSAGHEWILNMWETFRKYIKEYNENIKT